MLHLMMFFYVLALAFCLSPGVFLRLPSKGSKYVVAAVHAVLFTVLLMLTKSLVWKQLYGTRREGATSKKNGMGHTTKQTTLAKTTPANTENPLILSLLIKNNIMDQSGNLIAPRKLFDNSVHTTPPQRTDL